MYRVRKTWKDASSQIGAFDVLTNAVASVDANPDYTAFDDDGVTVYKALFRVRKSWANSDSQIGAYSTYANATSAVDKNDGYRVYDYLGVPRYPLSYMVALTSSAAYYTDADGATKVGTAAKGTYTITEVKSPYGKLKSGVGWLNLTGLDVFVEQSGPEKVLAAAASLADTMMTYNSSHSSTKSTPAWHYKKDGETASTTFSAAKSGNKAVTCGRFASWLLQEAGCLASGKTISHSSGKGVTGSANLKNSGVISVASKTVEAAESTGTIQGGDILIFESGKYMTVYAGSLYFYEAGGPFAGKNTKGGSSALTKNDFKALKLPLSTLTFYKDKKITQIVRAE